MCAPNFTNFPQFPPAGAKNAFRRAPGAPRRLDAGQFFQRPGRIGGGDGDDGPYLRGVGRGKAGIGILDDDAVLRRDAQPRAGALLALFILLIFGFAVYNVFSPKRETSELENRRLAQLPAPSAKTLLNGQWADDLATYLQDQVAFRDFWIDLESAVSREALDELQAVDGVAKVRVVK